MAHISKNADQHYASSQSSSISPESKQLHGSSNNTTMQHTASPPQQVLHALCWEKVTAGTQITVAHQVAPLLHMGHTCNAGHAKPHCQLKHTPFAIRLCMDRFDSSDILASKPIQTTSASHVYQSSVNAGNATARQDSSCGCCAGLMSLQTARYCTEKYISCLHERSGYLQ